MKWMDSTWAWLSDAKNQKTLSFIGGGLVVILGGGWQLYQYFSKPEPLAVNPSPITSTERSIVTGKDVSASASTGGTAIVTTGDVNVGDARPEDVGEIIAHANALKEQAWSYELKNNDIVNAEILLKDSVEVLKKGLGPDNPNVARHLIYLASLYKDNSLHEDRVEPLAKEALAINENESAAIFAKACFGHPSPSKRKKLRGSQCLRRPQPSCFIRWIPGKGYPTSFSQ
ncbi:MAG: hypothetical protein ACXV74_13565 [Methylobacter sp.]